MTETPKRPRAAALAVGAGILLSRLSGLVRERVLAHHLGNSEAAGAFKAALRIPNLLQNLFGEGVLSASFIPVYSRLRAAGNEREARQVARVVFTALLLVVALFVALGLTFTELLVDLIAPGFEGAVRALTVELCTIIFPGVGLLVLSAWCLGVQNSHGRFFLSYVAPVVWNAAQIGALWVAAAQATAGPDGARLTHAAAWGTVIGAGLQLAVQLPSTLRLLAGLGLSLDLRGPARQVFSSFVPVVAARGVVQISAYVDQILASFVGAVAVSAISYAQQLYLLPVSLFGMAISAAALPELSALAGEREDVAAALRQRVARDRARMAFFVVPSAVALVGIGDAVIALVYQTGRFAAADTRLVWAVLAAASLGLYAATQSRLLSSALYALSETRAPLRCALARVALGGTLGWVVARPLRVELGLSTLEASSGLMASAALAAWLELALLTRALRARVGPVPRRWRDEARLWAAALSAGALAFAVNHAVRVEPAALRGVLAIATFGLVYAGAALALDVAPARELLARSSRRGRPAA